MNKNVKMVVRGIAAALLLGAPFAIAHSDGHESRTPAQCEKLPGTAEEGERAACIKCVTMAEKHHYHPDYPEGERCRPNNRKP